MMAMNLAELDRYIEILFERHDEFGPHYVRRQCEWAQAQIGELEKSSSMPAPGTQGAVFAPSGPVRAS